MGMPMMVLGRHTLVHGRFTAAAGTTIDSMECGHFSRLPILVEDVGPVMGKVVSALVVSHLGLQRFSQLSMNTRSPVLKVNVSHQAGVRIVTWPESTGPCLSKIST